MWRLLKRIALTSLVGVALVLTGTTGVSCGLAAPGYRGPVLAYFDGEVFQNQIPVPNKTVWTVAQWRMTTESPEWEERRDLPGAPPPERVGTGELRVTWINHATALVQMDGVNILTDPIWSDRASPFGFIGPERYRAAGIRFEDLPPIDVVVVSHNHYDHFDTPSLARLAEQHRPRIVAGLGSRAILAEEGIAGGEDLGWWDETKVGDVTVTVVPAQHWSRRGIGDTKNTLWAGFVIQGSAGPVYYSGDTGWGPHFEQVRERFGPMRLALLPIGAFRPRWFMRDMHISPEEAVDAARILGAQITVPIHWGTFKLGDDEQDEPPLVMWEYLELIDNPPTVWLFDLGEGRDVPPLDTTGADNESVGSATAAIP